MGVSSIPVSEVSEQINFLDELSFFQFYCDEHVYIGENYARFSFCKDVETLKNAGERLQKLKYHIVNTNGTKM